MSKKWLSKVRYRGGDGNSRAKAIIICGARSDEEGVAAEYAYLRRHFAGVSFLKQELVVEGGRYYDRLLYDTNRGQRQLWFDCTDFFRKHTQDAREAIRPIVEEWLKEIRRDQQAGG